MLIELTRGLRSILDDDVPEEIKAIKWNAHWRRSAFYASARVKLTPGRKGKSLMISMHRLIVGAAEGDIVDHINGNTLDNRRSNLRICSRAQNKQNARKKSQSASQYKGVRYRPGKKTTTPPWMAVITANGERLCLGRFATEIEAARCYDEAAKRYFGEFANCNL
jgi:hypothetical protein